MAMQDFSSPSGRNLNTKVAAPAGGKSIGSGFNKGQNNGGTGTTSDGGGKKPSPQAGFNKGQVTGGSGSMHRNPGKFSGGGVINGKV